MYVAEIHPYPCSGASDWGDGLREPRMTSQLFPRDAAARRFAPCGRPF